MWPPASVATPAEMVRSRLARARLLDGVPHALGDLERLGEVHAREQHEELLAADPVDELEAAQRLADLVGHVAQDGVAALVAVGVVHGLEAVEVEQDQGDGSAGEVRLLLDLEHARVERGPVQEAGERVEHGAVAMLQLTLHEGGHDRGDRDQQRQSARSGEWGRRPRPGRRPPRQTPAIAAAVMAAPTITTWGRKRAAESATGRTIHGSAGLSSPPLSAAPTASTPGSRGR